MDMETVNTNRQDLKPIEKETMQMVEGVAVDCLQDTMVEVFKHRGMAGLAPFLERFLHELEAFARECCGRSWDEYMQRAIVSSRLATEYLPKTRAAMDGYRDGKGDFQRRTATWDSMLAKVSVDDRAFIESIKKTDSTLQWLLSAREAQDRVESQEMADLVTQRPAVTGRRRYVR
jgi:hypothetical protein